MKVYEYLIEYTVHGHVFTTTVKTLNDDLRWAIKRFKATHYRWDEVTFAYKL